ncbi:MAG TPA: DNA recombination protein RmuC [Bryobacteraceae bacterium]|nr:DNA recombination protein RmuC [Bryobacteraceae bacterium]
MTVLALVCLAGLLVLLAVAVWQWQQAERWRRVAQDSQIQCAKLTGTAEAERKAAEERVQLLHDAQQKLEQGFRALASEALQSNSQMFLDRSREQMEGVVAPVRDTLLRFDQNVQQLETSRAEAYGSLSQQIQNLMQSEMQLRDAADQLKTALRTPHQRGRWGELQLRRAVEMAGMLAYCDFDEQQTLFGERNLRPDMIVHLPNGRDIVVDAKVSLEAYLRATECQDDAEREQSLADHARQVRTHVKALSEKAYWERLPGSPDFVIAFLPLESLYSAALLKDGELLNYSVEKRVLLATPTTLIALLYAVAHGWREREFTENAERIRDLGKELYERIVQIHGGMSTMGKELNSAVEAYNSAVWNLENRVFVSARKFRDLQGSVSRDIEPLSPIDTQTRALTAGDWGSAKSKG